MSGPGLLATGFYLGGLFVCMLVIAIGVRQGLPTRKAEIVRRNPFIAATLMLLSLVFWPVVLLLSYQDETESERNR